MRARQTTQPKNETERRIQSHPRGESPAAPQNRVLQMQRSVGNQATLRSLSGGMENERSHLSVSQPGDWHEQEAERVASSVANAQLELPMINRAISLRSSPTAKTSCGCNGETGALPCAECAARQRVQRSMDTNPIGESATDSVDPVLRSPGRPLDQGPRQAMERQFGRDLGQVRIHTDVRAAESARSVNAKAYTVGSHIVFGTERYSPGSSEGLRLIAHELTHVVQQGTGSSRPILQRDPDDPDKWPFTHRPWVPMLRLNPPPPPPPDLQLPDPRLTIGPRLIRRPWVPMLNLNIITGTPQQLDLNLLDQELKFGWPLTQTQGEIGHGSRLCPDGSRNCESAPAAEDPKLPVEALVFPRTPPASAVGGSAGTPGSTGQGSAGGGPPSPAPRALVVGGIHGDEGGAPQHVLIAEQLQSELGSGLARDFDTMLIPVMNPGGLADNKRWNRHGVDLNRNFPGLPGFPSGSAVVEQPEVAAVRRAVQIFQPSRILVLHAQGDPAKGGVYADPVEGEARELACRMAIKMQNAPTASGPTASGTPAPQPAVPGNRLTQGVCDARYPDAAAVSVTTKQSSLGAWGSAPTAVGGGGAVVITHEIPDKNNLTNPLPAHGAGRSVDSMMPGIRDFLLDNRRSPSEADALLTGAVTKTFLSGQATAADLTLRNAIADIVLQRFKDLDAFYRSVWRPSNLASMGSSLPISLGDPGIVKALPGDLGKIAPVSPVRDFSTQAGIMTGQLTSLTATSSESAIETAILLAMQTRSMPGFSRHHWGTDIDIVSATRTDWDPAKGRFRNLIPFLQEHAFRFGFFHPYTAGYNRSGGQPAQTGFPVPTARHYLEEPWHLSYWPISNVLLQLWLKTFSGTVLDNLILETARAVRGPVPEAKMVKVLTAIGLQSFHSNVAPSP